MDHVAGLDTLFYCLSSGGAMVCLPDRDPATVCRAIEAHRAELLPASAAFLNLLVLSHAHADYDLSSLKLVAYGSEMMPASTLRRLGGMLPQAAFVQKYGTTELGSPRTRTREDRSLWLAIEDEAYQTRVVDGTLWIRGRSTMLGYLNAPDPFQEGGWINTGDHVEVDGKYIRFLGRKSDLINVGGHKVYPAEVEDVILQMDNVRDATVFASPNPIMGQVVGARVALGQAEDSGSLKRRLRGFCQARLAPYKVPVVIEVSDSPQVSARHKKNRACRQAKVHG
jgi:acyl-CoA synthetase (AMP-forming)/AMP-acid ligase II